MEQCWQSAVGRLEAENCGLDEEAESWAYVGMICLGVEIIAGFNVEYRP